MFSFALKEVGKRKKTYALNILLIGIVVALIISMNSLSIAYKTASKLPFESVHSNIIVQRNGNVPENVSGTVLSCSLAPISHDYLAQIKNINGVTDISAGLQLWVFDNDHFKRIMGVNWNDSMGLRISRKIVSGSLPINDDQVLLERTYADQYNITVNSVTEMSGKNFTVYGIVDTSGREIVTSDAYISLTSAQNLAFASSNLQQTETFNKGDVNIIFVGAEQTKVKDITIQLNNLFNTSVSGNGKTPTGQIIGTYTIYTPESFEKQISTVFSITDNLVLIISLIVLIVSSLIIIKSMTHAILERRKEIGIMKAVGFRNRDIRNEIMLEMFLQIIIGYIVGLIISFAVIFALSMTTVSITIPWELNPYPHFLVASPNLAVTSQTYNFPITFSYTYAIIAFGIVLVIGLLTTLILTKKINNLKAMEVIRNE